MQQHHITFNYKAPYLKVGAAGSSAKSIWIIFHGYGQLAEDFMEKFSVLNQEGNLLIFPQGLSKFYLKGIDEKVGASWMTAHDRETDIDNYIQYLDRIYELEVKPLMPNIRLNILGFSQGVHTATRWIYRSGVQYHKLVLWGAGLAHEIEKQIVSRAFNQGAQYFVIGDKDRFISAESLKKIQHRYATIGFEYQLVPYQGMHDIVPEALSKIC